MITLNAVNKTTVDVREGEVITSWWKLWDVITYSCRNYRLATVIKGTPSSPSKSNCPSGIFTQFVEYGGCLPGQPDGPLKWVNSSPPGQNGRHFADDIFKYIKISLKFIPNGPISNIPALVQIMAWRRPGDKPLSESMLTRFTDACAAQNNGGNLMFIRYNQHYLYITIKQYLASWLSRSIKEQSTD